MDRLENDGVSEVIMGLNPTLDGDATALFLQGLIETKRPGTSVTRLARGLPAGGSIEYANKSILMDALQGRQAMRKGEG